MESLTTINHILRIFERFRMKPNSLDQYEIIGKDILANKMISFIRSSQPLRFIMLGFPFKSINTRDKVLGEKPDMGEQLTIENFKRFNKQVKEIYSPGAEIIVASDGYLFNDLLGVADKTVDTYGQIMKEFSSDSPVKLMNLSDFYGADLNVSREKITEQFGISWEELEKRILMDVDTNFLYKGMIRFMEEELSIKQFPSGNQLHKAAKSLARNMMLRNEAYSNLIKHDFKDSIRLSMHESINNGQKYSWQLIDSQKAHHSAWHSVIVKKGTEIETMHKKDAQAQGFELIYQNKQPFYFNAY